MDLTSLIAWIIVGLIAGWLAGVVMKGGGYGVVGDIILGIIGALVGGFIAGAFGFGPTNLIGSIIIAFIGAVIVVFVVRLVTGRRAV